MPIADFSLKNKVAVVSGASRGIGETIARGFVEQGATVVLCSRKQEALDPVAESINSAGGKAMAIACHTGKPEMIAAHSSPVMVEIEGSRFFAAADAVTILEQIEGAMAHVDTVAMRASEAAYKRMRLVLTSAHRKLHNEMHRRGRGHRHRKADLA